LSDYLERRSFTDEICRNSYFIDVHWAKEELDENGYKKDWEEKCFHMGPGESHGIPYRCLIPTGVENVLVAGRSISCEQIVQGSVRVMPVCLAMGEAAGIAASVAAKSHEGKVRSVPVDALRARLKELGGYLPDLPANVVQA